MALEKIIPTLATLDIISLEQIRAVVREELVGVSKLSADDIPSDAIVMSGEELTKKLKEWKPKIHIEEKATWTPENEDTFLRGVLRSRLSLGVMSLPEYRVELARLDKQKIQVRDTSTVASLPDEKPRIIALLFDEPKEEEERRFYAELYGHTPLTAEIAWQGNVYYGKLDFNRIDVGEVK